MIIAAKIIGVVLLLLWLFYIPVARRYTRTAGSVMHATVFQYNILPFITGVGLIVSGNLMILIVFPIAWILSRMYPTFFMFGFPLVFGWVLGSQIFKDLFPDSKIWYYGGGAIGLSFMFAFCTIVVAIIMTPSNRIWKYTDEQNNEQ